jgi:hypothetical protein
MVLSEEIGVNKSPIPLRAALKVSLDLTDAGAAIRDAGTSLQSAGSTIMLLQELPPVAVVNELRGVAGALLSIVDRLAKVAR